jgi:hypothetical protein
MKNHEQLENLYQEKSLEYFEQNCTEMISKKLFLDIFNFLDKLSGIKVRDMRDLQFAIVAH